MYHAELDNHASITPNWLRKPLKEYLQVSYTNVDQFLNILDDLKTLIAENPPDIIVILMKHYWNPSQPVFIKYSRIFSLYDLYYNSHHNSVRGVCIVTGFVKTYHLHTRDK